MENITIPATGNPICVTGSYGSPSISHMYQTHNQADLLTKHNKSCWDRFY